MAGPRHPPWYQSNQCTKCDYLSTSWFDSDLCVYHRGERPPVCELVERPAMGVAGPRHPSWYHSIRCTKCDYLSRGRFDSDLCVYHRGERPPVCELVERPAVGVAGPRNSTYLS